MENEPQEQEQEQTRETEKKTRVRLLSPRKQLQKTLLRMEKLVQSDTLKEAKAADILLSMADLQKLLLKLTLDEEQSAMAAENDSLTAQHEQDTATLAAHAATIAQLNAELARVKANPTIVTKTLDPDAGLRGQLDAAKEVITHLAKRVSASPAAVAAYGFWRLKPETAKLLCEQAGIDYKTWAGFRAYDSPAEWKGVLNRAVNGHDTDLCRFCLANLEANGERWEPPVEVPQSVPVEPRFDTYSEMVAQRMGRSGDRRDL